MTWRKHINQFRDFLLLERGLAISTTLAFQKDVGRFYQFLVSREITLPVQQITAQHVRGYIQHLNEAKGVKAITQLRYLTGLRMFFDYILRDLPQENPLQLIELPQCPSFLPKTLYESEINDIENQIDPGAKHGLRNAAIIDIMYSCGLRRSEVVNIRISNFRKGYIQLIGKGNKERMIPVNGPAMLAVNKYIKYGRSIPAPGQEDYLFLNAHGHKLSGSLLAKIISKLAISCGIKKKVSPHRFRHSFATHLVENGADLPSVQQMLGHASVTTTEIYAKASLSHLLRDTVTRFHPHSGRSFVRAKRLGILSVVK